nr:hypothetical protein [Haemoproteus tartakovskyi]
MIIIYKHKLYIKNNKSNLYSILNIKFKNFNINITLLYQKLLYYIQTYKLNIFIIHIYSTKLFTILFNYSIYYLYLIYNFKMTYFITFYKILIYKKLQLNFYTIYQLSNIIQSNLYIFKIYKYIK